jgi:hypothetical protein
MQTGSYQCEDAPQRSHVVVDNVVAGDGEEEETSDAGGRGE